MVDSGLLVPIVGQLQFTFNRHFLKLSGVGNMYVLALRRKDNGPAGRSCAILLHSWFAFSSSTTARTLD